MGFVLYGAHIFFQTITAPFRYLNHLRYVQRHQH